MRVWFEFIDKSPPDGFPIWVWGNGMPEPIRIASSERHLWQLFTHWRLGGVPKPPKQRMSILGGSYGAQS